MRRRDALVCFAVLGGAGLAFAVTMPLAVLCLPPYGREIDFCRQLAHVGAGASGFAGAFIVLGKSTLFRSLGHFYIVVGMLVLLICLAFLKP